MKTLLQISSSIHAGEGHSTRLARRFVKRWQAANPGGRVILRDLAEDPVPHLDAARFEAFRTPPGERTPEQARVVDYSDRLIEELRQADVVVLGLPLYNFGIPSTLKAYFDHIARAGVTFRYTPEGPVGLLGDKTVHVLATRGGRHAGTPGDTQTPFLRNFLAFLGIGDVRFMYVEGLAIDADSQRVALERAEAEIDRLTVTLPKAA